MTKYIFVTGGVLSGLGKGITAASLGKLLKARGLSVNIQKLDPYLNVDAGTLNPAEHGECFVTADGAETDLDLGHYERFMDIELTTDSSVMSGRILQKVIEDEREGAYLGKTVQIVPHVTGAMQDAIEKAAKGFDVHIAEVGGTVGDIEGQAFIEAIREFAGRVGRKNCIYLHVVYVPYLGASKEFKTKPAQNAVRSLRSLGIVPDVLAVRSESPAPSEIRSKISMFSGVDEEGIALLPNAETVYGVPLELEETGIADYVAKRLNLTTGKPNLSSWRSLVSKATQNPSRHITIGMIAKYMDNEDTYISVTEALAAACWSNGVGFDIDWINSEKITANNAKNKLKHLDCIVVPGGFGERGMEGKIAAADFAMNNNVPYLGLCLGMQMAVVAKARMVLKGSVNTAEVDEACDNPVIHLMEHQKGVTQKGGTMRLGSYECVLLKGSKARELYGSATVSERHRHRYEFNNTYREVLEKAGLVVSGESPDGQLVEMVELKGHQFFIATQFHPEFKSRPERPHPLFNGFVAQTKKSIYNTPIK